MDRGNPAQRARQVGKKQVSEDWLKTAQGSGLERAWKRPKSPKVLAIDHRRYDDIERNENATYDRFLDHISD